VSDAEDTAAAEREKLNRAMAITSAESTVIEARMADLVRAQRLARRRWSAAKGLVTRVLRDGSAAKIAAAQQRERGAYAEFDRIGRDAIEEMLALNRGGLDNLGHVLGQMSRTWAADAEVTRQLAARQDETPGS
jgi:hypothetical protein